MRATKAMPRDKSIPPTTPSKHLARQALVEALEFRTLFAATHLAFGNQLSTTVAGQAMSAITIDILDGSNALVTTDNSTIVLSIASGPTGSGNLSIPVQACKMGVLPTLLVPDDRRTVRPAGQPAMRGSPARFPTLPITPGTATQLVFVQQPTTAQAGMQLIPSIVAAEDPFGNIDASFSGQVTFLATVNGQVDLHESRRQRTGHLRGIRHHRGRFIHLLRHLGRPDSRRLHSCSLSRRFAATQIAPPSSRRMPSQGAHHADRRER